MADFNGGTKSGNAGILKNLLLTAVVLRSQVHTLMVAGLYPLRVQW